jgi:hypothetical protein
LRKATNTIGSHECLADLALTYAAQGLWERADETAATLIEFDSDPPMFERFMHAHSLRARLALARGDRDSAQRWVLSTDWEPLLVPTPLLEVQVVTRIRVLLAMELGGARQAFEARGGQRNAESISCAPSTSLWALALEMSSTL